MQLFQILYFLVKRTWYQRFLFSENTILSMFSLSHSIFSDPAWKKWCRVTATVESPWWPLRTENSSKNQRWRMSLVMIATLSSKESSQRYQVSSCPRRCSNERSDLVCWCSTRFILYKKLILGQRAEFFSFASQELKFFISFLMLARFNELCAKFEEN